MNKMSNNQHQLLMLNLDTMKWSFIGISANQPKQLFIDSNEILTLKVGNVSANSTAFYRLALK